MALDHRRGGARAQTRIGGAISWRSRLLNLFRASDVDRNIDEELQFHVERRMESLIQQGMTREAARLEALRRFGPALQLRERSHDVKVIPWQRFGSTNVPRRGRAVLRVQ